MNTYIGFLRGINVSGHHKVPMADLKKELEGLGCRQVVTILNSGNIIFDAEESDPVGLGKKIQTHIEAVFDFPIPTILKPVGAIDRLLKKAPFEGIEVTKEIRLYVSFLWEAPRIDLDIPWTSEDRAYRILDLSDGIISSVLDLSITNTPKAMEALEKFYGKGITTRNWNTIKRIEAKLAAR